MSWKPALLAGAIASVTTLATAAEAELSPQDLGYVAAQEIKLEQETLERLCGRSSFGTDVKRRHAEFVAANPDYTAALAAEPADPAADARAQALITRYRDAFAMVMRMASGMPPELFCPTTLRSAPETFAARVDKVRTQASRVDPPAPVDPDAALPEAALAAAELDEAVRLVLQHPDVAMYLHPEVPERVPVRVALAAPYASARLGVALYGKPVRVTSASDRSAVLLTVRATEKTVKVTVAYAPEGIHGTVRLSRDGAKLQVTEARIFE